MVDLSRFLDGQSGRYNQALGEIRAGRKTTHWMWFIFPQIDGLGTSPMARHYAIRSAAEARAYLDHAVLGPRLRACTMAALRHSQAGAERLFGVVDAMKFRSSMTLFESLASDPECFAQALDKFFDGARDPRTMNLLEADQPPMPPAS